MSIKKMIQYCCEDMLISQVCGLLDIEIGNELYEMGLNYEIIENGDINMFIIDDTLENKGIFNEKTHIVHLHNNDMIWAILNIKELKNEAIERAKKYVKGSDKE